MIFFSVDQRQTCKITWINFAKNFSQLDFFINIEKCEFLTSNTAKSGNVPLVNHSVPAVSELKYLGLIISESLHKARKPTVKHTTIAIKRAY